MIQPAVEIKVKGEAENTLLCQKRTPCVLSVVAKSGRKKTKNDNKK